MSGTSNARATAMFVVLISVIAACNSGAAAPTTTVVPARPTSQASTPATTADRTSTSTSTSTTTTTTIPATTTTTLDDLKAQIAADFERVYLHTFDFFATPSLDHLDDRLAEIAVPGSGAFAARKAYIEDLVRLGDRVVPNVPDILKVTIENVELIGAPPYKEAKVTSCKVTNRKRVTPAENSPVSIEAGVGDSGKLVAERTVAPVQLTSSGWLPTAGQLVGTFFEGQDSCPAS
jgi:hypothetical protein